MELAPTLLEYGLPGVIIIALVYDRLRIIRDARTDIAKRDEQIAELHSEMRQTLREVFPVVETLRQVLRMVEGGPKNG